MFVDTHAHLFFKDFNEDIEDVILRAREVGVARIVCPGTDLETSRRSIQLADRFETVYAAVGFHPHDARKAVGTDGSMDKGVIEEIMRLASHPKVVAIGEIGLDYHYNYSQPEIQRAVFAEQIRIAHRCDLPIIIHTRESESDALHIVERNRGQNTDWRKGGMKGVFHCFSGDVHMAKKVVGWGFFVSIPGPVTFREKPGRPTTMTAVVERIGMEHILLETDSPFLTPRPLRGMRNEPANIPLIAKKVADIKEMTVEHVGAVSTRGAESLFEFR
jgi:TatD DNase family protein